MWCAVSPELDVRGEEIHVMPQHHAGRRPDAVELRLFLEELACDICRFSHASHDGIGPQAVRIRQEVRLDAPDAFADIVVEPPGRHAYIVEVDYGYSQDLIVESLRRKYQRDVPWFASVARLIVVFDARDHPNPRRIEELVRPLIPRHWELELWDEAALLARVRDHFGVDAASLESDGLLDVRAAIDRAKGMYAFGEGYENAPLDGSLLWHFGYWRLRELCASAGGNKREILSPDSYSSVVIVYADLCGFSGYVRDTPHHRTIQECLTVFCSKARYQIINDGGMVYQFLGDAVIGLFGIPDQRSGDAERAFECARSLLMLGESVSHKWQRQLDRIQPVRGSHVGLAIGDLQLLSLRPFSRTHVGVIGDAVNMAARLSSHATSGQIVVSNRVYGEVSAEARAVLRESVEVSARNVGMIRAWVFDEGAEGPRAPARAEAGA
jgi:class 3 adenylate cyclase